MFVPLWQLRIGIVNHVVNCDLLLGGHPRYHASALEIQAYCYGNAMTLPWQDLKLP
jgi:hypothetical protein